MARGTPFLKARGAPGALHYARRRGVAPVKARLEELSRKYGDHFKPAQGWSKLEG